MSNSNVIRTILFNILVILTILFIYFFFFPKKSYTKEKLDKEVNPIINEIFNQNINAMKIASNLYFDETGETKVTIEELKNRNLLAEIKDSNNEVCNKESYVKKDEAKTIIHLDCNDKKDEIIMQNQTSKQSDKFICIYQYEKKAKYYTEYSEWSNWNKEKVEKDNLTNVETKTEKEITSQKQIEDAQLKQENICENGYTLTNGTCKKRTLSNNINASLKYSCKEGYRRNGSMCYKGNNKEQAIKTYSCPENSKNVEYELKGTTCNIFSIRYKDVINQSRYICKEGFELKDGKCYKNETYQEITYYRYQKREEKEKIDIKWSSKNDENLLNQEYNMVGMVTCEF